MEINEIIQIWLRFRDLLYKVIFQDPDCRNAVCWAEKYPETKEPDTLITFGSTQSQEIRPQGLDLGRSTASNQAIANLRPRPRLRRRSSKLQFYLLPKFDKAFFVVVLQKRNANAISGSCLEYDVIPSKPGFDFANLIFQTWILQAKNPVQSWKKIQLDISNWRIGKIIFR